MKKKQFIRLVITYFCLYISFSCNNNISESKSCDNITELLTADSVNLCLIDTLTVISILSDYYDYQSEENYYNTHKAEIDTIKISIEDSLLWERNRKTWNDSLETIKKRIYPANNAEKSKKVE